MIKIVDAKLDQSKEVCKFLSLNFNRNCSSYINIFKFYKLFNLKKKKPPPLGYILKNNEEILGFIGILSHQYFEKGNLWVLNMTTWIVNKEMRAYGLKLLMRVIKNRNCIISNFSPSLEAEKILQAVGFKVIDKGELLVSTYKYFYLGITNFSNLKFNKDVVASLRSGYEKKIFNDHLSIGCAVFSIEFNKKKISFIFLNCKSFFQFIHSTDLGLMQSEKLWKKICFVLIFFYRARKIRVDARFLSKFIKAKKINSKKMLLFGNTKPFEKISRIYSEPLHKYGNYA